MMLFEAKGGKGNVESSDFAVDTFLIRTSRFFISFAKRSFARN